MLQYRVFLEISSVFTLLLSQVLHQQRWSEKKLYFTVSSTILPLVQYAFAGQLNCLGILEQNFVVWLRLQACVCCFSLPL